jgi:hypothetical protein
LNLELIQGCRFGEAALSRGDLTEAEWHVLRVLLPVDREVGKRGRPRLSDQKVGRKRDQESNSHRGAIAMDATELGFAGLEAKRSCHFLAVSE